MSIFHNIEYLTLAHLLFVVVFITALSIFLIFILIGTQDNYRLKKLVDRVYI